MKRRDDGLGQATEPPSEWDETPAAREFWRALREHQPARGRLFPAWEEILELLRGRIWREGDGSA